MISKSRFRKQESADVKQLSLSEQLPQELDYMANDFVDSSKVNSSSKNPASKRATECVAASIPSKRLALQVMEEKLIEGVKTSISSENKGFKLLQKYGYTEGGLGKDQKGITDPVPMAIRLGDINRSGIGLEQEKKRKADKFNEDMQKVATLRDAMVNDFKARLMYENEVKRARKYVRAVEKVIYEYDLKENIENNHLWPQSVLTEVDPISDDDEAATANAELDDKETFARLQECLVYVREKYRYCYFCGFQYNDADDLVMNCPGLLYDDH